MEDILANLKPGPEFPWIVALILVAGISLVALAKSSPTNQNNGGGFGGYGGGFPSMGQGYMPQSRNPGRTFGISLLLISIPVAVYLLATYGKTINLPPQETPVATVTPAPSSTTAVMPPVKAPTRPVVYTVLGGDTLSRIATWFSTSVDAIVAANAIQNRNLIKPNQKLVVPVQQPGFLGSSIIVAQGETLEAAAQRLGFPLEELLDLNGLSSPSEVKAGDGVLLPRKD